VISRLALGILAAGVVFLAPAAAAAAARSSHLPVLCDTLVVEPGSGVACLHRPFIFRASLELYLEGRLLAEDAEFRLDPDAGCLSLLVPDTLGVGRTLVAHYQALPLALEGTYRLREDPHRRRAPSESPGEAGAAGRPLGFTSAADVSDLDISGSKTLGVEVGNRRDLKLRQSLDLRLTGKVSRDVSLLAILSDQDIPFQPEGNTAELAELDRILVRLESPRAGASLGDFSLATGGFSFLDLRREVEGFSGNADLGVLKAQGAIASARGEFASREFFGEEGKQGPYRLTDRTGSADIVVVAGSEKIWLDGVLLRRGAEEDYVIEYSLGEITFTSRRVITARSTISVDYEYATGRYRRRVGYAGAEGKTGSLGLLKVAYFTEGDDPDDPLGGDLTEAERELLAAQGDSARLDCGTRYVGPDQGDYDLVVDAVTGKDIYAFVDRAGDYLVEFVDVGDGKGEYAVLPESSGGRVVYGFVGEGNGRYIPCRDLPAPESRRVGDLQWEASGSRGRLSLEGAVSRADGNVLSSQDDGDNSGTAILAEGEAKPVPVGGSLRFTPRFRWRRVGERFESSARLRPGFFGREWNLSGTETIRDENLAEAGASLAFLDRVRWTSSVGHLALADTFSAFRQEQVLAVDTRWVGGSAAWNTVREEVAGARGDLDRWGGEVVFRRYAIEPRVRGLHESRERAGGDGERHRDWETALLLPSEKGPFRGEIGVGRRLDDSLATSGNGWNPVLDTRRGFTEVEGRWRDVGLLLRYEARSVEGPSGGRERRDTARIDARHQALRGAWSALVGMNVGTVGLRQRTKDIVADSTGYYDAFGNYVGPGGGYDVRVGPPGDETLTGHVDLSTRLRWSPPGDEVKVARWLRGVAWDGYVNLTESSALPLVQPRYFLDPDSYLNPESTLDGRLSLRQNLDLFPSHRPLGFRFRHELRKSVVRNPGLGTDLLVESRDENTVAGTVRSNPTPAWDAELEGSLGTRGEEVNAGSGGTFVQSTDLRSITLRGGRRFETKSGRGRLSTEVVYSEETGEDRQARGWVFRPRAQWSLPERGRLEVRASYTDLVSRSGFTGIAGPGSPLLVEGWRLDMISEVRVHRAIVISGVFGVDHPAGISPVTVGRIEVRGTF
jgi:hypothetical protein